MNLTKPESYTRRTEKHCSSCNTTLPIEQFYFKTAKRKLKSGDEKTYYYPRHICISCYGEDYINRRQSKAFLHHKYGITNAEFDAMLEAQDNKCAICGVDHDEWMAKTGNRFCIDHCHTTQEIRGLLCMNCNTGLGHFKDSADSLHRAIQYLTEAL